MPKAFMKAPMPHITARHAEREARADSPVPKSAYTNHYVMMSQATVAKFHNYRYKT